MYEVMDSQPGDMVVFGKNGKTFTLYLSDIVNKYIFNMLPGGSTPAALKGAATYSNTATWSYVPISTKGNSYGAINNNLLSQTMTFFFNLGWNSDAGSLEITGDRLVTIRSNDCGETAILDALPDTFSIPNDVLIFMAANGYGNTLQGLLNLANDVLGGLQGISPSSVTGALDAFNRGFDDCRLLVEFYSSALKIAVISKIENQITREPEHNVWPNPFSEKVNFEFRSPKDAKARLDLYDIRGSIIQTLFDESVKADQMYKMEYIPQNSITGVVLYRLTIDGHMINGKLIRKP
jgi:hypothetical protein